MSNVGYPREVLDADDDEQVALNLASLSLWSNATPAGDNSENDAALDAVVGNDDDNLDRNSTAGSAAFSTAVAQAGGVGGGGVTVSLGLLAGSVGIDSSGPPAPPTADDVLYPATWRFATTARSRSLLSVFLSSPRPQLTQAVVDHLLGADARLAALIDFIVRPLGDTLHEGAGAAGTAALAARAAGLLGQSEVHDAFSLAEHISLEAGTAVGPPVDQVVAAEEQEARADAARAERGAAGAGAGTSRYTPYSTSGGGDDELASGIAAGQAASFASAVADLRVTADEARISWGGAIAGMRPVSLLLARNGSELLALEDLAVCASAQSESICGLTAEAATTAAAAETLAAERSFRAMRLLVGGTALADDLLEVRGAEIVRRIFDVFSSRAKGSFHHASAILQRMLQITPDTVAATIAADSARYVGALLPYLHAPTVADTLTQLVLLSHLSSSAGGAGPSAPLTAPSGGGSSSGAGSPLGSMLGGGGVLGGFGLGGFGGAPVRPATTTYDAPLQLYAQRGAIASVASTMTLARSLGGWGFLTVLTSHISRPEYAACPNHIAGAADVLVQVMRTGSHDERLDAIFAPLARAPLLVRGLLAGAVGAAKGLDYDAEKGYAANGTVPARQRECMRVLAELVTLSFTDQTHAGGEKGAAEAAAMLAAGPGTAAFAQARQKSLIECRLARYAGTVSAALVGALPRLGAALVRLHRSLHPDVPLVLSRVPTSTLSSTGGNGGDGIGVILSSSSTSAIIDTTAERRKRKKKNRRSRGGSKGGVELGLLATGAAGGGGGGGGGVGGDDEGEDLDDTASLPGSSLTSDILTGGSGDVSLPPSSPATPTIDVTVDGSFITMASTPPVSHRHDTASSSPPLPPSTLVNAVAALAVPFGTFARQPLSSTPFRHPGHAYAAPFGIFRIAATQVIATLITRDSHSMPYVEALPLPVDIAVVSSSSLAASSQNTSPAATATTTNATTAATSPSLSATGGDAMPSGNATDDEGIEDDDDVILNDDGTSAKKKPRRRGGRKHKRSSGNLAIPSASGSGGATRSRATSGESSLLNLPSAVIATSSVSLVSTSSSPPPPPPVPQTRAASAARRLRGALRGLTGGTFGGSDENEVATPTPATAAGAAAGVRVAPAALDALSTPALLGTNSSVGLSYDPAELWGALTQWVFLYPHTNMFHVTFGVAIKGVLRANHEPTLALLLKQGKFVGALVHHYEAHSAGGGAIVTSSRPPLSARTPQLAPSAACGTILRLLNSVRLAAAALPPASLLTSHLRDHTLWAPFVPTLRADTLATLSPLLPAPSRGGRPSPGGGGSGGGGGGSSNILATANGRGSSGSSDALSALQHLLSPASYSSLISGSGGALQGLLRGGVGGVKAAVAAAAAAASAVTPTKKNAADALLEAKWGLGSPFAEELGFEGVTAWVETPAERKAAAAARLPLPSTSSPPPPPLPSTNVNSSYRERGNSKGTSNAVGGGGGTQKSGTTTTASTSSLPPPIRTSTAATSTTNSSSASSSGRTSPPALTDDDTSTSSSLSLLQKNNIGGIASSSSAGASKSVLTIAVPTHYKGAIKGGANGGDTPIPDHTSPNYIHDVD